MRLGLIAQLFLRSSRVQRKRAVLTIAAIAWGSVSLLLLLSFGEGLRRQLSVGTVGMGKDIAVIWPGATGKAFKGLPPGRNIRVTIDDIELLRARMPEARVSGEIQTGRASIVWGKKTVNGRLRGVWADYEDIRHNYPREGGRFLDPLDVQFKRRVIFLGNELAKDIFGDARPEGQTLLLNGLPYTVVGVMKKKIQMGTYSGPDAGQGAIPISTFKSQFGRERISVILVKPHDPARMKEALAHLAEILGAKYSFDPKDTRALGVWDTVENQKVTRNVLLGIQIFLGVVGGLTLLIGGIGVANIMYAVVKERTREIGVKMALGARASWITGPLVLEGMTYTFVGGLIGLVISILIISVLGLIPTEGNEALEFLGKPVLSLTVGLSSAGILGLIGILAAYFPARRAARVDPAQTLRYE
jgi:putative ABC transport system permease protein